MGFDAMIVAGAAVAGEWACIGYRDAGQVACACDKCGQGIRYVYTLREKGGRIMHVGADCAVTIEGGPDLAALRAAERRAEWEAGAPAREAERVAAEARRLAEEEAGRRTLALFAITVEALRKVAAGGTEWERAWAEGQLDGMARGKNARGLNGNARGILGRALRTMAAKAAGGEAGAHVGTVKGKVDLEVTFHRMILPHPDAQFPATRYVFLTDEGATVTWKTSSNVELCRGYEDRHGRYVEGDEGKRFRLRGTVKAHGEYQGTKQTDVLRCKVEAL